MPENRAEKCKEAFTLPLRERGNNSCRCGRAHFGRVPAITAAFSMDEFQESIKLRNLYKALRKCCAGSMWKDGTALYRSDGLANSVKLRRSFLDGSYKLQRYMRFRIARPKPRDITATRIRDRHGQRSACDNVLYAKITRSFIYDNGACQINKGVDFAIERTKRWLRRIYLKQRSERAKALGCRPEDVGPFQVEAWVWKGDVKKYFPSTPHANAKAIIRKTIDSPELAAIFCAVIASFGEDWWRQRAAALGAGGNRPRHPAVDADQPPRQAVATLGQPSPGRSQ